MLERELGRVDPEHHEPLVAIPPLPCADVRERPDPIDARIRAEVDQDDASAQGPPDHERRRVQPPGRATERRGAAFAREVLPELREPIQRSSSHSVPTAMMASAKACGAS